jgi:transposase-like protein
MGGTFRQVQGRRPHRRDEGKREQWRKLIAEAARSGTSIREFCRQRGIMEAQFYAWRARLNGKRHGVARRRALAAPGQGATFALVSDAPGSLEAGIELVLVDGRRMRIARGVDEATLRTVLSALGRAPC